MIKVWFKAFRLPFLTATIVPIVLGNAIAWHDTGTLNGFYFLLTVFMVYYLGFGAFWAFFILYMGVVGLSVTLAGIADGVQLLVGLIMMPVFGSVVDRWSPRGVVLLGIWGDLLLVWGLWVLPDAGWVLPLMVWSGIAYAASTTGILSMAAVLAQKNRGKALNIANTTGQFAFTISPLIGGAILEISGFAGLIPLSLMVVGVAGIMAMILIRVPAKSPQE